MSASDHKTEADSGFTVKENQIQPESLSIIVGVRLELQLVSFFTQKDTTKKQ